MVWFLTLIVKELGMAKLETIANVSNDGAESIATEEPYAVEVRVQGVSSLLFHRWSCDDVEAKGKAKKGSKAKKEDNLEAYVWRDAAGELCIPGEYFRMSVIHAAKFLQDPRSPRKSAMDLFKAGISSLDDLCSLGTDEWDYLDRRRATVQRNGITRVRPAFNAGWQVRVNFQVLLPEYIGADLLNDAVQRAGRLVGVGDFRPTFGRFQVVGFKVLK